MGTNQYDIPPLQEDEKEFLDFSCDDQSLLDLYERIRNTILRYGKIEIRVTRSYISFKHPYKKRNPYLHTTEKKNGTVANVYFKNGYLVVAFNSRNKMLNDPKNLLELTTSYGVCKYIAKFNPNDNLEGLDGILQQVILIVSNEHRAIRINNRFVII